MNRAYSLIEIKAVDEDKRIIEGIATTPTTDRAGDIVEPMGAKFELPMPLLWQHRTGEPVGHVTFAKPTKTGIPFKAEIARIDEPGRLKDRLDEAWQSVKSGLVRAVSIGFVIEAFEILKSGGWRINEWEWLELSLVTIPMNSEATINTVKSIDAALLAASGQKQSSTERIVKAGVTASQKPTVAKEARHMAKKSPAEQIASYEETRNSKQKAINEVMDPVVERGETLDEAQKEQVDTLEAEIKQLDDMILRLKARDEANKRTAVPVTDVKTAEDGSKARSGIVVQTRDNVPPGIKFVRVLAAKYLAREYGGSAIDIAKAKFGDTPEVEMVLRTAVTAGTTTDATWAGPLVYAENMASEFAALLVPATIIGRIPGLNRVPFNIRVPRETTGASVNWVGEGRIKPVSSMAFDSITLAFNKVSGIVPITQELMRFSSPSAELLVRNSLVNAVAYLTDRDFLDPTKAEAVGVSPASITNGVTPIVATGATADAFRDDLGALLDAYYTANMATSGLVLVMTSRQAARLGMLRNTLGQAEFPNIGPTGGTIEGIPVVTSENIASTGGSPTDGTPIIAINAPEILVADDGGVQIDVSTEASIQMETTPDSPATASTITVSAFQYNMVFIRAERFITWKKRRDTAVQYISHAKYQ